MSQQLRWVLMSYESHSVNVHNVVVKSASTRWHRPLATPLFLKLYVRIVPQLSVINLAQPCGTSRLHLYSVSLNSIP
jgi:hypothetical protein